MKRILLLELCLLFLATTFQGDSLTGWVQQTIPRQDLPIMDLQFLDSLNGFFISTKPAVDTAFIFRTSDGGNNWSTTYFESLYLDCMDFVDKNIGYCGGATSGSGILKKTTNGGNNWFTVSSIPFILITDVDFINKDTGWICHSSSVNGGLWRTTNGGLSWQLQLDFNYSPSKIFFVNSSTGWVIGNSGVNLYKTTNSGQNWFVQSSTTSENYYDVFFANYNTGWIVKSIGNGTYSMIKSTNGGNNWSGVNSPIVTTLGKLFFINETKGWIGDRYNRLLTTRDGNIWGTQTSPIYTNYNVSFSDSLHGWAGYGGLAHTTDGGGPTVNVNQTGTEVAKDFALEQNYPNPFNSTSNLKFKIANSAEIKIVVFNIMGQEIQTLVNHKYTSGTYECRFNANNLTSGIYFYVLYADGKRIDMKKAILIK